ncbi:MAG: hypothetical protein V9G13_01325 [Marmoricola sp.]
MRGLHSVDDLLERRTRVALVPVDRVKAEASAQRALTLCQRTWLDTIAGSKQPAAAFGVAGARSVTQIA